MLIMILQNNNTQQECDLLNLTHFQEYLVWQELLTTTSTCKYQFKETIKQD